MIFSLKYALGLSGGTTAILVTAVPVTGERTGRVTGLPLRERRHPPGPSADTQARHTQAFHWVCVMIDV